MKSINIILLAIFVASVYAAPKWETRIIGGKDAKVGQFPYQVSLRFVDKHRCGGSILNNRFILTAAHCVDSDEVLDPSSLYVVLGEIDLDKNGYRVNVANITVHSEWNMFTLINDIALIRTAEEIIFTDNVQPIALPKQNNEQNTKVIASGWGSTKLGGQSPNRLQFSEAHTITTKECFNRFSGHMLERFVRDLNVCIENAMGVGMCHGDSGGPLVDITNPDDKILIGVASWVNPCARGYPDVFTRVYSYVDWIQKQIEDQSIDLE